MLFIPLSRGLKALIDDEDAPLARFKWSAMKGWKTYYACRQVRRDGKKRLVFLHREIMNAPKGIDVDHKDGEGLNCTRENMRLATKAQNQWNSGKPRTNKSGLKGVSYDKVNGKWKAQIRENGTNRNLGRFSTPEEAAIARDAAAMALHGEFARRDT